jgi:AraC-like DNA-binding protein
VQLARAKDLLREGTMPLKAISDFCGFENPNSLRKFFKTKTGMTMTEWRNCTLPFDVDRPPRDSCQRVLISAPTGHGAKTARGIIVM